MNMTNQTLVNHHSKPVETRIYNIEVTLKVIISVRSTDIQSAEIEAYHSDYKVLDKHYDDDDDEELPIELLIIDKNITNPEFLS